jgi:hypothetical protein
MVFAEPPVLAMTVDTDWQIWNLPDWSEQSHGRLPTNGYYSLKSIPSGRLLEFASREVRVSVWPMATSESLAQLTWATS